ncbi:MAG: hypothetical protein H8K09_11600 [Nitrospira sp.]|nr:hypothetical protein [Nitrospira sp.]
MNMLRGLMIAMMAMGAVLASEFPSVAAQRTTTETKTSQVGEEPSAQSAGAASKKGQFTKKRRSSGKSIVEETTESKSQRKSQDSHESAPGTTLKFGSGGAGVPGATGK